MRGNPEWRFVNVVSTDLTGNGQLGDDVYN